MAAPSEVDEQDSPMAQGHHLCASHGRILLVRLTRAWSGMATPSEVDAKASQKAQAALVKDASRKAEHIGRQVQTLDKVVNGIKGRYHFALENLQTLNHEMDVMNKQLAFMTKAREDLAQTIRDNQKKAEHLRLCQRRSERIMANTCAEMKDGAKLAIAGRPEIGITGSRQVNKNMITMDLEHKRGYSCKVGSTLPAAHARAPLSASMPTLPRVKA